MQKNLVCFALFYKHNGTGLRITEEDVNPLSVYRKDWRLDKLLFIT